MSTATAGITALVITTAAGGAAVPVCIRMLRAYSVYDVPNARSAHTTAVPRGAGLVLVPVFAVVSWAIAVPPAFAIVAVLAMASVGALDDLRQVGAISRLVLQLLLALAAGVLVTLEYHQTSWEIGAAAAVAAAIGLVIAVNAVNFMDGINGISGLYAVVGGASFLVFGLMWDSTTLTVGGGAIAGVGLALLPFNMPVARVFLGDSGSYGLGAISFELVVLSFAAGVPWWLATAPMHLYLCDVLVTLCRRAWRRRPLLSAHRDHAYQRLLDTSGSGHASVAMAVASASAVEIALLLIAARVSDVAAAVALGAVAVAVLVAYLRLPELAMRRPVR